jgi:hypothetical protein
MPQAVDSNTTDPSSAPTPSEMEAMWLAARAEDAAEVREFERRRAGLMRGIYGEAA